MPHLSTLMALAISGLAALAMPSNFHADHALVERQASGTYPIYGTRSLYNVLSHESLIDLLSSHVH